jgi:hypothetical protein
VTEGSVTTMESEDGNATRYTCNPEVVLREVDEDGALLFNPDTNRVRVVNRTGLFIWNLCQDGCDLPSIVAGLRAGFEAAPDAELSGQVTSYLEQMVGSGFMGNVSTQTP